MNYHCEASTDFAAQGLTLVVGRSCTIVLSATFFSETMQRLSVDPDEATVYKKTAKALSPSEIPAPDSEELQK